MLTREPWLISSYYIACFSVW